MTAPAHPVFVALGSSPAQAGGSVTTYLLSTPSGVPVAMGAGTGSFGVSGTDASATPGAATINHPCGRVAVATGQASVTVTNNLVAADSLVFCTLLSTDGTFTNILKVVPAAGSFVITGNATATGNPKIGFFVVKILS